MGKKKGNCVANIAISIFPVFHVSMCSGDSEIFRNVWWIFQSITQPDLILLKYDFNETKSSICFTRVNILQVRDLRATYSAQEQ